MRSYALAVLLVACVSDTSPAPVVVVVTTGDPAPDASPPPVDALVVDAGLSPSDAKDATLLIADAKSTPPSLANGCKTSVDVSFNELVDGWQYAKFPDDEVACMGSGAPGSNELRCTLRSLNPQFSVYQVGNVRWERKFGAEFSIAFENKSFGSVILAQVGIKGGEKLQLEFERTPQGQYARLQVEGFPPTNYAEIKLSDVPSHDYRIVVQPAGNGEFFAELVVDQLPPVSLFASPKMTGAELMQLGPYVGVGGLKMPMPDVRYKKARLLDCTP
jgi:hypothetical protein